MAFHGIRVKYREKIKIKSWCLQIFTKVTLKKLAPEKSNRRNLLIVGLHIKLNGIKYILKSPVLKSHPVY